MRFHFFLIKLENIKRVIITNVDGVRKQTLSFTVVRNVNGKIILEGYLAMFFKILNVNISVDPEKSTSRN